MNRVLYAPMMTAHASSVKQAPKYIGTAYKPANAQQRRSMVARASICEPSRHVCDCAIGDDNQDSACGSRGSSGGGNVPSAMALSTAATPIL